MRRLICIIAGHRRVRRRVWNDRTHMRTNCARCDKPIFKEPRTGNWIAYPEDQPSSVKRTRS